MASVLSPPKRGSHAKVTRRPNVFRQSDVYVVWNNEIRILGLFSFLCVLDVWLSPTTSDMYMGVNICVLLNTLKETKNCKYTPSIDDKHSCLIWEPPSLDRSRVIVLITSEITIILFFVPPKFCISIVFNLSWDDCYFQEKLKTILMQNFGGTKNSIMVFSEVGY